MNITKSNVRLFGNAPSVENVAMGILLFTLILIVSYLVVTKNHVVHGAASVGVLKK